jgi:Pumilio-family RNA binding repeat
VVELSKHKFASNVIEKSLVHGTPAERHALVETVLTSAAGGPDGASEALHLMMKDPYANYVVQKMLEVRARAL